MTQELQAAPGYAALLKEIKERVRSAQLRAALAVNRELILLYWSIGRDILARQQAGGWGAKIIERLARIWGRRSPGSGIQSAEPQLYEGFCRGMAGRTICATGYCTIAVGASGSRSGPDQGPFHSGMVSETPRSKMDGVKMCSSIIFRLGCMRQGKALTNFSRALPSEDSDLAKQILKDPYQFDFLTLAASAKER
jgi:hypothetical protein